MNAFLVGLQFLTRIHISDRTVWNDEEFGKSVTWFPVIGWIIGAFMCLIYFLMKPLGVPLLTGCLLVVGELFLTGGTLADGLMDSSDGLFSGRSKERCLEIMKDSPGGNALAGLGGCAALSGSYGDADVGAAQYGDLYLRVSLCPAIRHGESVCRLS